MKPINGASYTFAISLTDASASPALKINPTIALGDFKVSKDGGAFANLVVTPSVVPSGSPRVEITLTSAEMTADNVVVWWKDAAGSEWLEELTCIQTETDVATQVWEKVVSGTITAEQGMRLMCAALGGKSSGHVRGGASSPVYRDPGDSKDVITATTDASGNRSVVTLDLTA